MTGYDIKSIIIDRNPVTNYSVRQFIYDGIPVNYEETQGN